MSQQYTPLSSPNDQGPVGPRGGSDLCLQAEFHRHWDCIFLASGVCPLVGEAGLASLWEGQIPARSTPVELDLGPLVGRAMSRGVSGGGCGLRKSLGSLSVDGWDCVPALLVVWPEASQHRNL